MTMLADGKVEWSGMGSSQTEGPTEWMTTVFDWEDANTLFVARELLHTELTKIGVDISLPEYLTVAIPTHCATELKRPMLCVAKWPHRGAA